MAFNQKNQKFKVGDPVMLNSGGPKMTVTGEWEGPNEDDDSESNPLIRLCAWFHEGKVDEAYFHEDCLTETGKSTTF